MQILDLARPAIRLTDDPDGRHALEAEHAFLFEHLDRAWSVKHLKDSAADVDARLAGVERMERAVREGAERLGALGLATDGLQVILLSCLRGPSGHAFLHEGRPTVWIDCDAHPTDAMANVFAVHELAHGLHYAAVPTFDRVDAEIGQDPLRQVWAEGMATWLTDRALSIDAGQALWADVITLEQRVEWMRRCRIEQPILAYMVLSADPKVFGYGGPDAAPVENRGGYWLGLELVRTTGLPLEELMEPAPEDWRELIGYRLEAILHGELRLGDAP